MLVFGFGGVAENVEEDGENVANKNASNTEGNQRLERGEPQPVTKWQGCSQPESAEDGGYQ